MNDEELVPTWHQKLDCPGTLTYEGENGWQCSLDELCPMMEEVQRIAREGGEP